MAKPQFTFTDWELERAPAWAKEVGNYHNLVIAGAILSDTFTDPVPAGTLVMRALADRDDGVFIPFNNSTYNASTHEAYLTYHSVNDVDVDNEVTLYRHGRVVAYNKLPGWDDLHADGKAAVHALYQTIHAAE